MITTKPNIMPVGLRSMHPDGPQPGKVAIIANVVAIPPKHTDHKEPIVCYRAVFENGQEWLCPIHAIRDYEITTKLPVTPERAIAMTHVENCCCSICIPRFSAL